MAFNPPREFNIADFFLDQRLREGKGEKTALLTEETALSYREIQALANRYGNLLKRIGVVPEQRVVVALADGPEFVAAFFGILKIGAVVVMVNPDLKTDAVSYFFSYTRAAAAFVHRDSPAAFSQAAKGARHLGRLIVAGDPGFEEEIEGESEDLENFPTHRDDSAIWLFSGGTTGKPKAVVQTHRSFANTTECYAKETLAYDEKDITLSVPKLFFGYATGSNLLFPFAVGATAVLFPQRSTADRLFELIARFHPTILINVPTMIKKLVDHPDAERRDLSSLRLSTSAGEALPVELHERWNRTFGVELLDGLGTAEMWHIFVSNRPGEVKAGTLGRVVPGFEIKVCDDGGTELPAGETGWLWVHGDSRAIGYWQNMEKTMWSFRGDWVVTGDMVCRDREGYVTYRGRGDDMLKVSGKWLATREVEDCLRLHPAVREVAVVGIVEADGLTKPHAFIVARESSRELGEGLKTFVKESLEPYKHPRQVIFLDSLPQTHLGKVDRGRLRALSSPSRTDAG